jgi:hypothetical protein
MWPVNATPKIRERQIALQARAGVPSYLKKPNSKLYLGASFVYRRDAMLTCALVSTCPSSDVHLPSTPATSAP